MCCESKRSLGIRRRLIVDKRDWLHMKHNLMTKVESSLDFIRPLGI